MFNTKPFYCSDIFRLDLVNLDTSTENYSIEYYLMNLLSNSQDCYLIEGKTVLGYMIARLECKDDATINSHIIALSVSPQVRRNNIASFLMNILKDNSIDNQCAYIDLFVRISNEKAIKFYNKIGYSVHETIKDYYIMPKEDAYDMRLYLNN
ncbi:hypothetical protein H311_01003 [Anncaliia algerae PRA109]|uniref:N-acetyltransferase domain-containing protein n=1 Tax=Anncaliia algerae PRA339 TaxID=1288291 RepID=A0A059EWR0_9MICR|nr:hypothetical protein H311_01003 [Anncaliia algerae PRA109]KCZ79141.1 hypothetical protein H312_03472 [Anncaliia algerae PRA339]